MKPLFDKKLKQREAKIYFSVIIKIIHAVVSLVIYTQEKYFNSLLTIVLERDFQMPSFKCAFITTSFVSLAGIHTAGYCRY